MNPIRLPNVEPIAGEPGCFWVQSNSRLGIRHRVDMLAFSGNGACGCERFEFEVGPYLRRGAKPSLNLECRHIRLVRHWSGAGMWVRAAQEMERREKERKLNANIETKARAVDERSGGWAGARVYTLDGAKAWSGSEGKEGSSGVKTPRLGPPPVR